MTKCVCFNRGQKYESEEGHFCDNGMFIPGVANTSDTIVQVVAEDLSIKKEYDFGRCFRINVPSSTYLNDILREELRKATDTVNRDMHMNNDICMPESIGTVEGGVCFDPTIEIASATGNLGMSGGKGDGDVQDIYQNAEEPINDISIVSEASDDDQINEICNSGEPVDPMNGMNTVAGSSSMNDEAQWRIDGGRYACTRCGKKFGSKASVVIHFRSHTGEKPFDCGICDKRFSQSPNLKQHLLTHTGKKPFPCNKCARTFRQSNTLKRHLRTHSSPFACDQCGERYGTKRLLNMHRGTHTGENLYTCTICKIAFKHQTYQKRHYRNVHHIKRK